MIPEIAMTFRTTTSNISQRTQALSRRLADIHPCQAV